MLSCPRLKSPANDDRTVDIALDTSNLKILVACMTKDSAAITEQLNWKTVKRIVRICDTFGFEYIAARLLNSDFAKEDADSWDIFCVAAGHDQYLLARAIIPRFPASKFFGDSPFEEMTSAMVDQCAKPYLAQLLLAIGRTYPRRGFMDWRDAADKFRRP